mmetsp:Transcript_63238/g.72501  ORF Transcript_63238/g.72501 Transcript_63238/m.72501 type:complete len:112 (-) Transcript_63238:112-447(-)
MDINPSLHAISQGRQLLLTVTQQALRFLNDLSADPNMSQEDLKARKATFNECLGKLRGTLKQIYDESPQARDEEARLVEGIQNMRKKISEKLEKLRGLDAALTTFDVISDS